LHQIFREGWQWGNEQVLNFGGDLHHHLDAGIVSVFVTIGRYGKLYQPSALRDAAVHGMH